MPPPPTRTKCRSVSGNLSDICRALKQNVALMSSVIAALSYSPSAWFVHLVCPCPSVPPSVPPSIGLFACLWSVHLLVRSYVWSVRKFVQSVSVWVVRPRLSVSPSSPPSLVRPSGISVRRVRPSVCMFRHPYHLFV